MDHIKWYRRISFQVPALTMLCILIPVCILWYGYYHFLAERTVDNARNTIGNSLAVTSLHMEYMMSEVEDFARTLASDEEFCFWLQNYLVSMDEGREEAASKVFLSLNQHISGNELLDTIFLLFENSGSLISSQEGWGESLVEQYDSSWMGRTAWLTLPSEQGKDMEALGLLCPIPLSEVSSKNVSVLCTLKTEAWQGLMNRTGYEEEITLFQNYEGSLHAASPLNWERGWREEELQQLEQMLESQESQASRFLGSGEKRSLAVLYHSVETGCKYLSIVPMSRLDNSIWGEMTYITVLAMIGIAAALAGAWLLQEKVFEPLHALVGSMRTAGAGQMYPVECGKRADEIGFLIGRYNGLMEELNHLINEVYVQNLLRKQAQIKNLHSQMNEHFLYNIFNAVYCEACREGAENSADMMLVISQYFRLSLAEGKEMVPAAQIVSLMQYYIVIQKIRYGEQLQCQFHIGGELDGVCVPKYLFQPIVENAIVHGYEDRDQVCHIEITLERRGTCLYFEVRDDGKGIPAETLRRLRQELLEGNSIEGESYALKNITEQIRLTYGEGCGLEISSEEGQGTEVHFSLPIWEEKK
ncbi:sensor histidine kinase [Hominifimenecus sp. rT4P-3]|uniref:sensor histidine kinase n=1 Tax=Hominifimenecus sp. rT4P-3 TaxID=3242979 RepID=UPI003DA4FD91